MPKLIAAAVMPEAVPPLDVSGHVYAAIVPDAELVVYGAVAHGIMVTDAARLTTHIAGRAGA